MTSEFYRDFNPPDMLFIHDGCAVVPEEKDQQEDVWQPQGGLQPFADLAPVLIKISDASRTVRRKGPVSRCSKDCSCSSLQTKFVIQPEHTAANYRWSSFYLLGSFPTWRS